MAANAKGWYGQLAHVRTFGHVVQQAQRIQGLPPSLTGKNGAFRVSPSRMRQGRPKSMSERSDIDLLAPRGMRLRRPLGECPKRSDIAEGVTSSHTPKPWAQHRTGQE
jgi:hypothetical protein